MCEVLMCLAHACMIAHFSITELVFIMYFTANYSTVKRGGYETLSLSFLQCNTYIVDYCHLLSYITCIYLQLRNAYTISEPKIQRLVRIMMM